MIVCRPFRSALPVLAALAPATGWACAACYGQSDSPLAAGMNWGILSLLGLILFVLGGVAGFFIFLARRSAILARANAPQKLEQAEFDLLAQNTQAAGFARLGSRPLAPAGRRRPCRSAAHEGEVAASGNRW